ncbi:DUF3817 domain-containing protein [Paenibacillus validus]|uniref:DUF3817 domain-containing protein n=1 Tax=Paenibacillus validus TaxID=44253 RepID=UPI003D2CD43A
MLTTALGRLRLIGAIEGLSFLILLGIAMPLKYAFEMPQAVTTVGQLHGLFFVLYLLAIVNAAFVHRWSMGKIGLAIIAAFVPFGPFLFDLRLRKEQRPTIPQ